MRGVANRGEFVREQAKVPAVDGEPPLEPIDPERGIEPTVPPRERSG